MRHLCQRIADHRYNDVLETSERRAMFYNILSQIFIVKYAILAVRFPFLSTRPGLNENEEEKIKGGSFQRMVNKRVK